MGLDDWFDAQPEGAMTRMMLDTAAMGTPVSWSVICRAKRGEPISERNAKLISKYTKGKVPIDSLTRKGKEAAAAKAATASKEAAAQGRARKRGRAA